MSFYVLKNDRICKSRDYAKHYNCSIQWALKLLKSDSIELNMKCVTVSKFFLLYGCWPVGFAPAWIEVNDRVMFGKADVVK